MDARLGPAGLSIAEALELLRLSLPPRPRGVAWWSDMDYPLAGAHLMDLSFRGEVDTDLHTVTRMRARAAPHLPHSRALPEGPGGTAPIERVVEHIVARIGDLRAGILEALRARGVLRRDSGALIWGFAQDRPPAAPLREAALLRAALIALVEGDDLPSPEEAALVSVLHASGMIAEVLDVPAPRAWQAAHAARIEAIHRLDLVGQTVAAAIGRMRERLRAYVLRPEGRAKGTGLRGGALWEWRGFWPAGGPVPLPPALGLGGPGEDGVEEAGTDVYLFVHGKRDNIKFRGKGLKVKPVIEAFGDFCAFGPSGKVDFPARAEALSGVFPRFNEMRAKLRTREDMLAALSASGYHPGVVEVRKTRRQYRAILGVKVELARIEVEGSAFQSLSLESRFLTALRVLSRQVAVGEGVVGGYAEFLARVAPGAR